ncbi:MAG: hypothetical protein AABX08_00870 [Nanoarchaeota archaeon]
MDIIQITGLEDIEERSIARRTGLGISLDVIAEIPTERRCPHLSSTDDGPYCKKDFKNRISLERQEVCDPTWVQLYCCDDYKNCGWYKGTLKFKE